MTQTTSKNCMFVYSLIISTYNRFFSRMSFEQDTFVEFSKTIQDKVLGTEGIIAHVNITF